MRTLILFVVLLGAAGAARAESLALSTGGALACAIHSGAVRCWGTASNGGLGNAAIVESNTPLPIASITNATDVAVGVRHGCALISGGSVMCWGDGQAGQLGNGANPVAQATPAGVSGLAGPASAVATSNLTTCVLIQGGTVQCFGSNFRGQLGGGTAIGNINVPTSVAGISNAVALAAGATHFCAIRADGSASCWGDNSAGQLGDNSSTDRNAPVAVSGLSGVQAIVGGEFHSCASTVGGLKCWGNNLFGQLGDGSFGPSLVPVASSAVGGATITRLVAGGRHNCAQLSSGALSCWGRNFDGQLGQSDNSVFSLVGLAVQGLPGTPIGLAAGNATTCARLSGDDIRCVGSGSFGQLGDARVRRWKTPVDANLPPTAELAMGSQHTCARSANSLQCLGFNGAGALGDGSNARRLALANVIGSSGAGGTLASSETQTCNTILNSTSSQCWGRNDSAQLGTASISAQEPMAIGAPQLGAGRQFVQIALGTFFGCALLSENDGSGPVRRVRCWGRNNEGQLGNGTTVNGFAPTASAVANLTDPIAIGAGEVHACALEAAGTIKCWGSNLSGQTGRGSFGSPFFESTPVAVVGISTAVQLAVGRDGRHSCARLADGTAKCWGAGTAGQIGNNAASNVVTPAVVSGLSGIQKLIAGSAHSCALLATQAVKCWGSNGFDQSATPGVSASTTPAAASGLTAGVLDIVGGALHSCALLASGWRCWGYNAHGELANGAAGAALLPVRVAEIGSLFNDGFED